MCTGGGSGVTVSCIAVAPLLVVRLAVMDWDPRVVDRAVCRDRWRVLSIGFSRLRSSIVRIIFSLFGRLRLVGSVSSPETSQGALHRVLEVGTTLVPRWCMRVGVRIGGRLPWHLCRRPRGFIVNVTWVLRLRWPGGVYVVARHVGS